MDSRCIFCYETVSAGFAGAIQTIGKSTVPGSLCPDCQACYICLRCNRKHDRRDCVEFLRQKYDRKLVVRNVPSFSVAMKTKVFDTGAERIVRQFRFLDDAGNFAGPKWVAKESLLVLDKDQQSRLTYHKDFMRAQVLAQGFAAEFNRVLDSFGQQSRNWPRFRFLEPLVIELVEDGKHLAHKQREIMIEEMLDGKYQKFNNNNGFVLNVKDTSAMRLSPIFETIGDGDQRATVASFVGQKQQKTGSGMPYYGITGSSMRVEDFPQAFSHFSYERSQKQCMVVDLQGVFSEKPDGRCEFILTDPAIHRRDRHLGSMGRTDRGQRGIQAFLQSHRCNPVCHMLQLVLKES